MRKQLEQDFINLVGDHLEETSFDFPVCRTHEKADAGMLEWLPDDGVEDDESCLELITQAEDLAFEMCVNENGEVRNTLVIRTKSGESYGVPLSIEKLCHLGRWSLGNALHQLNLIEEHVPNSAMSIAAKAMADREVETTIAALKQSSEKSFADAIDKDLMKETVKVAEYHYRKKLAAAELKIRLELEKKYAEPLLLMADAIATGNDAALNNPVILEALIRAKSFHDDGAK